MKLDARKSLLFACMVLAVFTSLLAQEPVTPPTSQESDMPWFSGVAPLAWEVFKIIVGAAVGGLVLGLVLRKELKAAIQGGIGTPLVNALAGPAESAKNFLDSTKSQLTVLFDTWRQAPPSINIMPQAMASQKEPPIPPATEGNIAVILNQVDEDIQTGRPEVAEKRLTKACQDYPNDFPPFRRLVLLYFHTGRKEKALELLGSVHTKFKDHAGYFYLVGHVHQEMGKLEAALFAKQRSSDLAPNDCVIKTGVAFTLWLLGRVEQAEAEAEKALELAEQQNLLPGEIAPIKNSLAYYYAERGDPKHKERASDLITQALSLGPSDPLWVDTAGYVKLRYAGTREEINEAIRDFQRALDLGLAVKVGTTHITEAYEKRNQLPGQLGYIIGKTHHLFFSSLSTCYRIEGNCEHVKREYLVHSKRLAYLLRLGLPLSLQTTTR